MVSFERMTDCDLLAKRQYRSFQESCEVLVGSYGLLVRCRVDVDIGDVPKRHSLPGEEDGIELALNRFALEVQKGMKVVDLKVVSFTGR